MFTVDFNCVRTLAALRACTCVAQANCAGRCNMTREPRRPTLLVLHAQRDQFPSARLLGLMGWERANSLRYATTTRATQ